MKEEIDMKKEEDQDPGKTEKRKEERKEKKKDREEERKEQMKRKMIDTEKEEEVQTTRSEEDLEVRASIDLSPGETIPGEIRIQETCTLVRSSSWRTQIPKRTLRKTQCSSPDQKISASSTPDAPNQ